MLSDETKAKQKRKIELIVEAAEYGQITLNQWEESFINSIWERVSNGKEITMNQSIALNKIYARLDR